MMKEIFGIAGAAAAALFGAVALNVKIAKDYEKDFEEGQAITKQDGVIKAKGKYYAYCPSCGKKCARPQIIQGTGTINTAIFRCYTCNKDFEKKYDHRVLKG